MSALASVTYYSCMEHRRPTAGGALGWRCLLCLLGAAATAAAYPPRTTEITPEHPLALYAAPAPMPGDATGYGMSVAAAWSSLDPLLREHGAMVLPQPPLRFEDALDWHRVVLDVLQDAGVPAVVSIAEEEVARWYPPAAVDALLRDYTNVRGVQASGFRFNDYPRSPLAIGDSLPPDLAWLADSAEVAARYGRFLFMPLPGLAWGRFAANQSTRPVYEAFQARAPYVVPAVWTRGPHTIAQQSAVLGLWLAGAAGQWGVSADPRWYLDAHFVAPGRSGIPPEDLVPPPHLYRATLLLGAMTGANVYAFPIADDLWFGARAETWRTVIAPTLTALIRGGLVARRDFVEPRMRLGVQLVPSVTPMDFVLNENAIDAVRAQGLLMHAAYRVWRPAQFPELVPNRSDNFWIPLLPAHAAPDALQNFAEIVRPPDLPSRAAWDDLVARHAAPDGRGAAFIAVVGRGIFVLHTDENLASVQDFALPEVPAPVRGFTARREGTGVEVSWPFREGDVSYSIHRRVLPAAEFTEIASGLTDRRYVDVEVLPDYTAAYAITALTNEMEPYAGTVRYGEHLLLSKVESRIAEEVLLTPLLSTANSAPIATVETAAAPPPPWWPGLEGAAGEKEAELIEQMAARVVRWEEALAQENIDLAMEFFTEDYSDGQGRGRELLRETLRWLFARYDAIRLHRQARSWDFARYGGDEGIVSAAMYLRVTGVARTDQQGVVADLPMALPRVGNAEFTVLFREDADGQWRIARMDPALLSLDELLSYSTGPYDNYTLGTAP